MLLESLLQLMETLSVRIDTHGDVLRKSESLTRYALIDPVLRELGWDTEDPALVRPEHNIGVTFADYALLMPDGRPIMVIESKKLGAPLKDAVNQGINHCFNVGIQYFLVTNGQRWEVYDTLKAVPIDGKMVLQFDLKDSSAETCLKMLALWRYSVVDRAVSVGHVPVLEFVKEQPVMPPATIVLGGTAGWIPLSEFDADSGMPAELQFPDNSSVKLRRWKDITVETVRWMLNNHFLSETDCPIKISENSRRYLIATSPFHPTGRKFFLNTQIETLHIETNYSRANHINNTRRIIEQVNGNTTQFKVRLG